MNASPPAGATRRGGHGPESRARGLAAAASSHDDHGTSAFADTPLNRETVFMDPWTLSFHNASLEAEYRRSRVAGTTRLWERSLLASVVFMVAFFAEDAMQHDDDSGARGGGDEKRAAHASPAQSYWHLYHVFGPARLGVVLLQLALLALVKLRVLGPQQRIVLMDTLVYGAATVLLRDLRGGGSGPSNTLHQVMGVAYYTLPKLTPLYFFHGFIGSVLLSMLHLVIATFVRPVQRGGELMLMLAYLLPCLFLFNWIAYSTEKASRERFIMRQRLHGLHVDVEYCLVEANPGARMARAFGVSRAGQAGGSGGGGSGGGSGGGTSLSALDAGGGGDTTASGAAAAPVSMIAGPTTTLAERRAVILKSLLAWALFTVGGWVSVPEGLRGVIDERAALSWMWHLLGFTVFVVIVTRQMRWFVVNAVLGFAALWVLALVVPRGWASFAANAAGYVVLAIAVAVAVSVAGGIVFVWHELIAFGRSALQLVPGLQQRIAENHPVLKSVLAPRAGDAADGDLERDGDGEGDGGGVYGNGGGSDGGRVRGGARGGGHRRGSKVGGKGGKGRRSSGGTAGRKASAVGGHDGRAISTILTSEGPSPAAFAASRRAGSECYFCQSGEAAMLVPVCKAWGVYHEHKVAATRRVAARAARRAFESAGATTAAAAAGSRMGAGSGATSTATSMVAPSGRQSADDSGRDVHAEAFGWAHSHSLREHPAGVTSAMADAAADDDDATDGAVIASRHLCTPYAALKTQCVALEHEVLLLRDQVSHATSAAVATNAPASAASADTRAEGDAATVARLEAVIASLMADLNRTAAAGKEAMAMLEAEAARRGVLEERLRASGVEP